MYATSNTRQTVAYTTENSRITGNNVLSLAGDKRYIWLGIFGGKLNRFDILTHSFRSYDIPTAARESDMGDQE